MKLTLVAESLPNGSVSLSRCFDSGPSDLAERANLVHALRMFANSIEATSISSWQEPLPSTLEPAILEEWNCT